MTPPRQPSLAAGLAALRAAVAATAARIAPLPLVPLPLTPLPAAALAGAPLAMAAAAVPEPGRSLTDAPPTAAAGTEVSIEVVGAGLVGEPPGQRDPATAGVTDDVLGLVRRAQGGDAEAFGELYDRYVDLVYRYIYYRVGTRALAEDLTSETFLRALRRIGSFTWQGRDIGAWFVTIARNLVADHYKSGRFRLEVQVADMLDADRSQDGPEGEVLDAITNRTLLEAVTRLNPEQQECIVLRFLQGLSVAETALAMGKNEGAIKALQYRAVRSLGRLLPEGFVP